jgi:hypothetical protein
MTTGNSNTIIGAYTGYQGGLDIRTASNYIVLSDGDGNPKQIIPSTEAAEYGINNIISNGRASFAWDNVSSVAQNLATLLPDINIGASYGCSMQIIAHTQSSSSAATSVIIHAIRRADLTWAFNTVSTITSGGTTITASGATNTLTLTFGVGAQFGRALVTILTRS